MGRTWCQEFRKGYRDPFSCSGCGTSSWVTKILETIDSEKLIWYCCSRIQCQRDGSESDSRHFYCRSSRGPLGKDKGMEEVKVRVWKESGKQGEAKKKSLKTSHSLSTLSLP